MIPIRPTIFTACLAGVAVFSSCKERGEVERESLSEAGYEVTQEAFFRAAESDDVRSMKIMIESGLALDSKDIKGRTALHAAAGSGAMQSINFMLDRRMNVDVQDTDGRTPLMEAVLRSTPETVRYLLRQGANPLLKDSEKYKPMMLAVSEGRKNMVPELAPYVREDLDDALLFASILGQAGVIDELTNFGASIYARYDDGRTPLMLAAQRGHAEVVELLLEIGANRYAMDDDEQTAMSLAADAGHALVANRLSEKPQEGDFELSEPVELGVEMAAMVEQRAAQTETSDDSGEEVLSSNETDPGEMIGSELAANDDPSNVAQGAGGVEGGKPWNDPIPGQGEGAIGMMPQQKRTPEPLEGVVLDSDVSDQAVAATAPGVGPRKSSSPIVMRSYRQRELPLKIESADEGVASVRIAGGETRKIGEGSTIPGTSLKVIRVHRKMQSGKEHGGEPVEVSVVEIKDTNTGMSRDLVADLPALAHDPVALVEDVESGRYYVARTGQRFKTSDGTDYLVGDVRPNQVVIENMETHETITIPLRGARG